MAKQYINPGPISFCAVIESGSEDNSSSYVTFPYDLKKTFGVGNLVPIKATFDARVIYQGRLAKMGGPNAMLILRKDIRAQLGKQAGDSVNVVVDLDNTPREVKLSTDIEVALKKAQLFESFSGLAVTHRREYVTWIDSAKKPETRVNRVEKMIEMVTRKTKT